MWLADIGRLNSRWRLMDVHQATLRPKQNHAFGGSSLFYLYGSNCDDGLIHHFCRACKLLQEWVAAGGKAFCPLKLLSDWQFAVVHSAAGWVRLCQNMLFRNRNVYRCLPYQADGLRPKAIQSMVFCGHCRLVCGFRLVTEGNRPPEGWVSA